MIFSSDISVLLFSNCRYAGEVRLIMHYGNAKVSPIYCTLCAISVNIIQSSGTKWLFRLLQHPATTYAPSAPPYAAPPLQVPLYSAPPPTISASYPQSATTYPTPSPYPAYPSYPPAAYPPPPAAYPPPPPSAYPPATYPPASPYYPPGNFLLMLHIFDTTISMLNMVLKFCSGYQAGPFPGLYPPPPY